MLEDSSLPGLFCGMLKLSIKMPVPVISNVQYGAINHGVNWFFSSMYRPSCLIEAYSSPEKYWLVRVGLLVIHLFNLN
jgi:hypothetical protein